MNDRTKEMITAIGAMAEICGEMYRQLIRNGFDQGDALSVVKEYIIETLSPRRNNSGE